MTNNDELALNLEQIEWLHGAAEEAAAINLKMTMKPEEILQITSMLLALLAECDADKKRIGDMQDIVDATEKLVRCKGRYHSEQNYRALAALFGVKTPDLPPLETEVRELELIVPPRRCFDYAALAVQERDEQWHKALHDACKRAGIKLEVGE